MAKGDVETYYEGGQWKNRREGSSRAFSVDDTKAPARSTGRDAAKKDGVEHTIKNQDGKIAEKNTYPRSRDPKSSKG